MENGNATRPRELPRESRLLTRSIPRIAFDKDISGLTAILGALASVVAIFVYGRRKDAEERREKRSEFTSPQLRLPYDETAPETDRSSRANDRGAPG